MRRQRGFTLLIALLIVLVLGASLFLRAHEGTAGHRAERAAAEARAVGQSRDALIAYALAGGASNHPGALPCPDTDGDGVTDGTSCQGAALYLGRLPHETLDIRPDDRFGANDFWLVVDHDFADWNPPPVNPDSTADLEVDGVSGFAAALIVAGDPVAGQDASTDMAADHLEDENADGDASFATCDTDTCNDRVVGLKKEELLDPVRRRLLGLVHAELVAFRDAKGYLPYAAALGDPDGECSAGTTRGGLPVDDAGCASGDALSLEAWVTANLWHRWVYYAVADACRPGGAGCTAGASSLLSLAGTADRAVVFASVGEPIVSTAKGSMQDRTGVIPHDVEEYLDSPENVDLDETFDDPDNASGENDRLRAVAAPAS